MSVRCIVYSPKCPNGFWPSVRQPSSQKAKKCTDMKLCYPISAQWFKLNKKYIIYIVVFNVEIFFRAHFLVRSIY